MASPAPACVSPALGIPGEGLRDRGPGSLPPGGGWPRSWPASRSRHRAPSLATGCQGKGGIPGSPGCPSQCPLTLPWKLPHGLQAAVTRPFPELVTSGQRGPCSRARSGRRGRVCGGLWMRSRAGLAEPRPTYDLAWRGPRAWTEGQWWWPGAWGQALGDRTVGEGPYPEPRALFVGESSQPCQGGRSKASLEATGPVLIISS